MKNADSGGLVLYGKGLSAQIVNRLLLLGVTCIRQTTLDRNVGLETLAMPILARG